MAKPSREQVLIERYLASGRKLNTAQLNVPFQFIVRPTTTPKVNASPIACVYEDGVVEFLKTTELVTSLSGVAIFPQIVDPEIAIVKNLVSYRKAENGYRLSLGIKYLAWISATRTQQINFIGDNIVESINCIPVKCMAEEEKAKLIQMIEIIRQKLHTA